MTILLLYFMIKVLKSIDTTQCEILDMLYISIYLLIMLFITPIAVIIDLVLMPLYIILWFIYNKE
jgi:hypothetical protein